MLRGGLIELFVRDLERARGLHAGVERLGVGAAGDAVCWRTAPGLVLLLRRAAPARQAWYAEAAAALVLA